MFIFEEITNEMRKDLGLKRVKKGNLLAFFVNDINYLSDFSNFLDGKGELLKKVSGFHEDSEKEFINQVNILM